MTTDGRAWLISRDGRQEGPMSEAELGTALTEGRVQPATLAWTEGMPEWLPLSRIKEFRGALAKRGMGSMPRNQLILMGSLSVGGGMLVFLLALLAALRGRGNPIMPGVAGGVMAPGVLMLWHAFKKKRE